MFMAKWRLSMLSTDMTCSLAFRRRRSTSWMGMGAAMSASPASSMATREAGSGTGLNVIRSRNGFCPQ
jgi:hypothetical protein